MSPHSCCFCVRNCLFVLQRENNANQGLRNASSLATVYNTTYKSCTYFFVFLWGFVVCFLPGIKCNLNFSAVKTSCKFAAAILLYTLCYNVHHTTRCRVHCAQPSLVILAHQNRHSSPSPTGATATATRKHRRSGTHSPHDACGPVGPIPPSTPPFPPCFIHPPGWHLLTRRHERRSGTRSQAATRG